MEPTSQLADSLTEFVRQYQVCWEVWPELLFVNHKQQQIGFQLELSGTHDFAGHHGGYCPGCKLVFQALHGIVDYILPPEGRPSRYEVGPYEQALRYSPMRGNRPDVMLTVRVLHREGFDLPVDACEVRCLEEMKSRLKQLGACQGRWSNLERRGA